MKTFTMLITEMERYKVEVEAETESEAFSLALERMENEGRDQFHDDSDGDYEVLEEA